MPYVEVWVEEGEFNQRQIAAVNELVRTARRVASGLRPSDETQDLERACDAVIRSGLPVGERDRTSFIDFELPIDKKYREWKEQRIATAEANAPTASTISAGV